MDESSIKKQLASGVFYTAAAKYAGIVISIIITGVLSRLLTPEDFGTIVPVTVLVSFFAILGDIGIGPAIIQNNELSRENINSIFSFTVWVGGAISVLFFMGSWLIAGFYDNEIFVVLCQVLTVSLFFSCANVVPNALLYKAKMFRFLAVRSLVVQLFAGVVAIISACFGAGLYALIVQSVIASVGLFIVSYQKNPLRLHLFKMDMAPIRKIRSFSSYQLLFNILNFFSVNLDKLLLKKYMGSAQLGYYDKSYKLMQMPLQNIPFVITPVMHPIFSDMQHDLERMRIMYAKVIRFLSFIGFPLSILLYFTGEELIFMMFGMQWADSIPVFRILALSVGFQIVLSTSGSIFQASNATNILLLCGILSTITTVAATLAGLIIFGTIEILALLLLGSFILNFFICYLIMYRILFKTGFMHFLQQLVSPLVLTAILTVVLYALSPIMGSAGIIVPFLLKSAVAGVLFVLYIQYTKEYDLFSKAHYYLTKFRNRQRN